MRKVIEVNASPEYTLLLRFDDGVQGEVNVSHLVGKGIFELWLDREEFMSPSIGGSGELTWGNDSIGLCPNALYMQITGKKLDDLLSVGFLETTHA